MLRSLLHRARRLAGAPFVAGVLVGAMALPVAAAVRGSAIFPDVVSGSYYDDAIGEMYAAGVIRGYDNGNFGPDDPVTRGQIAVMMERFRDFMMDELERSSSSSSRSTSSRSSSSSSSSSSDASTSSSSSSNNNSSMSWSSSLSSIPTQGAFRFTGGATVAENAGTVNLTIVRTGGKAGAVAVNYTLTGGTATWNVDYPAATGTVNFASGETSKTFQVTINDDGESEGDEYFYVLLSNPTNGSAIAHGLAQVTITDNEASSSSTSTSGGSSSSSSSSVSSAGTLGFSALAYSAVENGGPVTITVIRTNGSSSSVSVNYSTNTSGTASASEFSATSGVLSFGPGETSKTFTVGINDDTAIDGNKTIGITLNTPTGGATLGTSTANITVVDDESSSFGSGSLQFSASSFTFSESAGNAVIVVNRLGGSKGTVSVNYATSNGTALAGTDYTAVSGTLTFAPNETSKTFLIPLVKDDQSEGEETISLLLSNPTNGASLGSMASSTVVIVN